MLLSFDFNETDRYFSDFFQTKLINYPRDNTGDMRPGSPFAYRLEHNDRGFTEIILKNSGQTCGLLKSLAVSNRQHPSYLHLYADIESARDVPIDKFEQEAEFFPIFQDLLMSMTDSIEIELGNIVSNWGYLALVYVMPGGSPANNLQVLDEELGIKGGVFGTSHPIIMYSVDGELFCASQAKVQDRSVECRFMAALLALIETNESSISEILTPKLKELASEKKMVNSDSFALPYRWHQGLMISIDDTSKAAALQTVAYAMDDSGIEPGEYYGKDANRVIRESQAALTKAFESKLSQFAKTDLLIKLYEALANFSHTFFLHTKRYTLLSDLQEKEKARFKEKTLDERENARRNLRTAMFSIETLLALGGEGTTIARKEDVARLLAIGEQLLSSSDAADMLLFEPKGMGIEVAHNHVATTIEVEDLVSETRNIKQRQILDHGHAGSSYTEDKLFIERAKASFEADTEIPFDSFIDVLDVLSLDCLDYSNDSHVSPNVISANKSRMVEELSQSLNGDPDTQMSERCLDFLTLDVGALKQIGGKQLDYLPFGRVKDRPNRLELKPLLALDNQLVYSPVQIGMLKRRWLHGIMDRFLPVKVAFPKLSSTIEDWKRRYEKTLETDVEDCFISNGFPRKDVYRGLELCKKGNHPQYLGDYDGLAYDTSNATIWVVECKEYEKVESAYDYMQLQQRWFGQDGKLLKFERRIKYMQDHLEEIANDLGLAHQDPLQLRPYLVSNKIFTNLIGNSNFQVITLSELNELLSRRTC